MDMSEFQEKHEVSLPPPNMFVGWLEGITTGTLTHAVFFTNVLLWNRQPKIKSFYCERCEPIVFQIMYKGLGHN